MKRGIGGSGLVATLRRGTSERTIGLRSDMDGLPITEDTGLDYASRNPSVATITGDVLGVGIDFYVNLVTAQLPVGGAA